jgi:hypothetical protein
LRGLKDVLPEGQWDWNFHLMTFAGAACWAKAPSAAKIKKNPMRTIPANLFFISHLQFLRPVRAGVILEEPAIEKRPFPLGAIYPFGNNEQIPAPSLFSEGLPAPPRGEGRVGSFQIFHTFPFSKGKRGDF